MRLGLIEQPLQIMYTEIAVDRRHHRRQPALHGADVAKRDRGHLAIVEEAAISLGAPPCQTFRRVLLPLALPGVLAGTILTFILAMNAYATPVLLGGPKFQMMGPLVYGQFSSRTTGRSAPPSPSS